MLDHTDLAIISLLKTNCKMRFSDMGELVHLTGQAVSSRIARLEKEGIIRGYSVLLDETHLGKTITAYVTVFMKTTNHRDFHVFIKNQDSVREASRISGEGCYWLKLSVGSETELNHFLDEILQFGNYRVNLCIDKIK